MSVRNKQELYRVFAEFIQNDIQHERKLVNRRMFSVLLWCFLLPVAVSITILILIAVGVLSKGARGYLEWMILVFPVMYSLYILGSEVLMRVPHAFRHGGIASSLGQSLKDSEWRMAVTDSLKRAISGDAEDWDWLIANFQMDLEAIRTRTNYLTGSAGAVFFLLLQGIDAISPSPVHPDLIATPYALVHTSANDTPQYVGMFLVLVLLYLSGNQAHQTLSRYLNCAKLVRQGLSS